MTIGIIGLGFVGGAMYKSFIEKGLVENKDLYGYDKFKNGGIGLFDDVFKCDILFLVLPTHYNSKRKKYDIDPIIDTCYKLEQKKYHGVIVIKSTIEPETTNDLSGKFKTLAFVHNPEFLTARTAYDDFHNQHHIVLGKGPTCSDEQLNHVVEFYKKYYENAEISLCTALESESMKIFANSFYSVKIQFFTELYLVCQKTNCDFTKVKNMIIKNNWVNPQHTNIPGPDGLISYGGLCFPKDSNALNEYMKRINTPNKVLNATIEERNDMRDDHLNCS